MSIKLNRHINGYAFEIDACRRSSGASESRPRMVSSLKKKSLEFCHIILLFLFFFFFFYPPEVFIRGCHGDIRVDGPSPCKGVYYRPGKRCLRCSKRTMLQEFEVGQLKEDAASRCSLSQIACNNCFLSFVKSLRIVLEFSFFFSLSFSLLYLLEMGL